MRCATASSCSPSRLGASLAFVGSVRLVLFARLVRDEYVPRTWPQACRHDGGARAKRVVSVQAKCTRDYVVGGGFGCGLRWLQPGLV